MNSSELEQQNSLDASTQASGRVRVDGKFFRLGARKFHVKGITYGPFAPNASGDTFASPEQTAHDFDLIRQLGANVLRVYYVPPRSFLDLAQRHSLKVLIDIPWAKHLCFLDSAKSRREARAAVTRAIESSGGHPAIFAYSVVNEIPAEIVRWSGVRRVEKFIDELVSEGKRIAPHTLFTFTSYPPTEFLRSENIDFVCFNVYLHDRNSFESYLARLQTLADARPLMLGEFGMDSIREGEAHKCEFLAWQIESAFRCGLAGTVVFSFTDDWFRGGMQIEDWGFGITERDRTPKKSFEVVRRQYEIAPHFPLPNSPRVSVVVATYNGARTLRTCLESLARLNYPDYEVILVDDGSKDKTPEIARNFPSIRYIRQDNQGLSAARNAGIRAATGEVVAFTDDDCRADEDWLYYLVSDLVRGDFAGVGGHNFLPPEDSPVAAAVVVSPGGPAHVMLSDREAEHIPGCNMAYYKWALEEIGMFDPVYRKAGDDVDVCWRLQDRKYKIGFSPAGFVWHYRRSTVKAYLKQQAGYGEAEALLIRKHPEHFNSLGGGIWHGRIYASGFSGLLLRGSVIYHGVFGSGLFQRLYEPDPVQPILLFTSLGYHVCVNVPLLVLACYFNSVWPLASVSVGISVGVCLLAGAQAKLPKHKLRFWSRPLVALLFFLQPIVRGWARFKWKFTFVSGSSQHLTSWTGRSAPCEDPITLAYWSKGEVERFEFLNRIMSRLKGVGWNFRTDTGWTRHDLELAAGVWTRLRLKTVCEELEQGRRTFRCRIESRWTLPAKILMTALVIAVTVSISLLCYATPWIWLALCVLPLLCWFLNDETGAYVQGLKALIDESAATGAQKLVPLNGGGASSD